MYVYYFTIVTYMCLQYPHTHMHIYMYISVCWLDGGISVFFTNNIFTIIVVLYDPVSKVNFRLVTTIMLYVPAAGNNSSIFLGKYFPISYDFIFNNK